MKRIAPLVLLGALAACGSPSALPSAEASAQGASATAIPFQPDYGASALPGAKIPCGFPPKSARKANPAACPVGISVHHPAIRNPHQPVSAIPGLHPSDLAAAYALITGGAGAKVAVVDAYDDPRAESDLGVYRSRFGLPACTSANGCFQKINQKGQTSHYPHANRAWSQEIALDIEMVSAVCPNCSILLVEANSASIDDLGASVDEAVALGAVAVSNSYYTTEWPSEAAEDAHYNHPSVAMTASSGDKAAAYYPAASPFVTAVGGTSLKRQSGAWSETPWQYGGSGCSLYEVLPPFQAGISCATRSTVDMAVIADPQTGVSVFSTQSGGWVVAGGTSVGAPIVAAAYALSGNETGPAFSYAHRSGFRAIPPASPGGYALATGLGAPNGVSGL